MNQVVSLVTVTVFVLFAESLPHAHPKSRKQDGVQAEPQFTEKYFTQTMDHFNFNSMGNGTFSQRYLITDKYWQKGYGPIFFYTGNEGDIWEFAINSGFITELAAQQRALVIFAEHRYYGKSLPFGKDSFNIPQVGLLTVEQALADYSVMITGLKQQLGATDSPVIVFGGSYGGMLSVYMRIKYPNVVAGALAASAPVLSTAGLGDSRQFFQDVTADFERVAPECRDAVRGAFHQLKELAEHQDYKGIQAEFTLCKPPSSAPDIHQLYGLLRNAFTLMAMLDYPYSTHFIGNMPANPVKVACETMLSGSDLLANLRNTAGIVYNATGLLTCFDLYSLYLECADPTGCGLGYNSLAWDYQACTEVNLCHTGDASLKAEGFRLLLDNRAEYGDNREFLWRLARAYIDVYESTEDKQKKMIYAQQGRMEAELALKKNGLNAECHKWFAVLTGLCSQYEGMHGKLKSSLLLKEHLERAIFLRDDDPMCFYLLGRWSYEVATLDWFERKAAAALYHSPPYSTLHDALENFLKAEELSPGFSKALRLYIAKCHKELGNISEATNWTELALNMTTNSDNDEETSKLEAQLEQLI